MTATRTLILLAVLGTACADHADPLSDPDQIAGWANAASALGVFTNGYDPVAFADGELDFADAGCPARDDDGTTAIIDGGGCVDSEGTIWTGAVTATREGTSLHVELDGYNRSDDPDFIAPVDGTFDVAEIGPDEHAFDASLARSGGLDTEIAYSGTVAGGYDGATLWNGSGTISRAGLVVHDGTVEAETVDQLRDNDVCPGQGISGTTRMVSDEHEVVITYDGADDCDDDDAARWSLDGVDQGLVTGVSCSAGGAGSSGAWLLALAVGLGWCRRRAWPSRT